MKKAAALLFLSGLISFGLLLRYTGPASATSLNHIHPKHLNPNPVQTSIVLWSPGEQDLGRPFTLFGVLKEQNGPGIANKTVLIMADGKYLGQASTNRNGLFQLKVSTNLTARQHRLLAAFNGGHLLYPTTTSLNLQIQPAVVKVQTIPAMAGVTFQMDGIKFVSDSNGEASVKIYEAGQYQLNVLANLYKNASQRIEFSRWTNESFSPSQVISVPTDNVIQVGINVYHRVSQSFVDLDGVPVDPKRVTSITIKSAQGDVFTFKDNRPHWIPASRVARWNFGLEETKLLYSVINVKIDGSNVVNQAQQRFYSKVDDNWIISLQLYSLKINPVDGLFGQPIGKSVLLTYPDGETKSYPLGHAGTVEIHSLARGIYRIELVGAKGLKTSVPVALSRNQDVNVKMLTFLDIAVIGVLGILVGIGLLLFGRPWLPQSIYIKIHAMPKILRSLREN